MSLLHITKYKARHPRLKYLIKYYWIIKSDKHIMVNHKLLPVNNIDVILNFSSPIKYTIENKKEIVPTTMHFNGIRDKSFMINQSGKLDIIGISFFPMGLYPLIKVPLCEFKNKTIELESIINGFTSRIEEEIRENKSMSDRIDILEKELINIIGFEFILENKTLHMFNSFYRNIESCTIKQFCNIYGINQRQLERYFKKYIGISPKFFQRLNRYQKTINAILHNKTMDLTKLAYENNYYDQNHFIKEFKSFTGCTPTDFFTEKKSVKAILKSN